MAVVLEPDGQLVGVRLVRGRAFAPSAPSTPGVVDEDAVVEDRHAGRRDKPPA